MNKCENCDSTEFYLADGYYYCIQCNMQSERLVIEENFLETIEDELEKLAQKIKQEKVEEHEITSWELFNYVLIGLVDQLIDLGAPEDLKFTTLQLWTEHLRRNEVAFFEKLKPVLPRLGARFYNKDAEVLYNRKPEIKRKMRYKSSKKSKLAQMEHASFLSTQNSDLEQSLLSVSTRSTDSGSQKLRLVYSRKARKHLKKQMSTRHLLQHENDTHCKLTCHRNAVKRETHAVNRSPIMSIICISLNIVGSDIQIGDLLRFMQEGHLSYCNYSQFLPENIIQFASKFQNFWTHTKISLSLNYYLRQRTAKLCKFLNVQQLRAPNIFELCKRYVLDLALPKEIEEIIERLIALSPPKMMFYMEQDKRIPSYEGRAMSYILFVFKLLFGMDDVRENQMSIAAEKLNAKRSGRKIFNVKNWMRFIEMRQKVIQKYHLPSFEKRRIKSYSSSRTSQYLNFLESSSKYNLPEEPTCKKFTNTFNNLLENIINIYSDAKEETQPTLIFPATLTPSKDYYELILNKKPNDLIVPDFMEDDFTTHDVLSYIDCNRLKQEFKNKDIDLKICKVKSNSQYEIVRILSYHKLADVFYTNITNKIQDVIESDMEEDEWYENLRAKKRKRDEHISNRIQYNEDFVKEKIEGRKRYDKVNKEQLKSFYKKLIENVASSSASEESDSEKSDDEETDSEDNSDFVFYMSNFDYWSQMWRDTMINYQTTEIRSKLPRNFYWLLQECAQIVEMRPQHLYSELLILENYFTVVLQPNDYIRNSMLSENVFLTRSW